MLKINFENQILALFDGYFWPFNKFEEKIKVIFVISAIMPQSEMFLSNSVDVMKNLQLFLTPQIITGSSFTIYYNYKNRCTKGPKILICTA